VRFVWISALKDLRRLRREPIALAVWVGIPLFIALLLNLVFAGGAATPQGRLLVVDEDGSFVSSLLAGAFSQGPLGKMFVVEKVEREAGWKRIERGDGSALLLIPKGFGQAFLRQEPTQLKLLTNPSQRILPSIVEETVSMILEAGFYLQALFGDQLRLIAAGPPQGAAMLSDQTVAELSVAMNRAGARLHAYLDPLLIELETKVIEKPSLTQANFGVAYFPGMLFMAVLFIAMGLSGDLWKERAQGALRRLVVTPARLGAFLAGKLLSAAVVLFFLGLAALLGARWLLNMQASNLLPAVFWVLFGGVALFLLMLLLQIHASSERGANILATLAIFPLGMLGGSFVPFEMMPDWLAAIGRLTPNGWAVVQLQAILTNSIEPGRLAAAFAFLALFSALTFLLALRRLRRRFGVEP
jgi:ABC-type multidrug transport system permease subunit